MKHGAIRIVAWIMAGMMLLGVIVAIIGYFLA